MNVLVRLITIFSRNVQFCCCLDHLLYDIPDSEWVYKQQFCPRQHLQINTIPEDMTAVKLTSYNVSQLKRMYHEFALEAYYAAHNKQAISLWTWYTNVISSPRKLYVYHLEELFLYMLAKVKTRKIDKQLCDDCFGGDYMHWHIGCRLIIFISMRGTRTSLGFKECFDFSLTCLGFEMQWNGTVK